MEHSKVVRNILLGVTVAVAAIVAAAVMLTGRGPRVPVVVVSRQNLSARISSNGKVEPISPFTARAGFPTFVQNVMAKEGQKVHRGQVVLDLEGADMRAQLAQSRANLLAAQTDLQNAKAGGPPDQVAQLRADLQSAQMQVKNLKISVDQLKQLVAEQAATTQELTRAQENLTKAQGTLQTLEAKKQDLQSRSAQLIEGAQLRVAQAQSLVQSLQAKVASATVISPIDGTLYSLPVKLGDFVQTGQVLAEMADLRRVRVRAFVDEPDLGSLSVGQEVDVTWDGKPGKMWKGKTEQLPQQVVARGMRSVGDVLCSIDNTERDLLPNTNVDVQILVHARRNVLAVPRAAVNEQDGQHYVYLVRGDRVGVRNITVGIASSSMYQVLSGLASGDVVAEPADQTLRNGAKIRPLEAQ
ncbi:MAG: efflux RND transporter periplasmic adaptor subunit [Acidobacteriota bacterium]|nr:efflux RND transporter periplasmic adaptor subunit [Acidobacteriota bacterium]